MPGTYSIKFGEVRQKLRRFEEIGSRNNTLEPGKELYETIKGNWNEKQFKNSNDLVLEVACGKGEYTVGLAPHYPDRNFIGIDIKGDRIWVGGTIAEQEKLENVAFLRTQVHHLDQFFEEGEVSEIWITFPDPRPKDRDEKRRLTYPRFLELYKNVLKEGGYVNFKTDNTALFEYTLEVLKARKDVANLVYTFDLYNEPELLPMHHGIKTAFEEKFTAIGEKIKFLRFQFQD